MKNLTIFLVVSVFTLRIFGQTEAETIAKANDLVANKKYESAFELLCNFDPNDEKPDIVLLKENIALNYFVTSIMHQMFAFKDLEKNENIMDYRGKNGSFDAQKFEIDKVLDNLIKNYPNNCKLYKGLADFYYEAYLHYGSKWLKDHNELFKLIEENNKKVIDGNCADYLTYFIMGDITISQEKFKEGIPYFLKSIELNKDYASSYYNVAYAYLYTDDMDNALKYAKISLDLYTDLTYKSDAARMLGQIYSSLSDDKNTLAYYELADKIDPGNYDNLKLLLSFYLKTDVAKVKEITKSFFNLAPTNPTIYNDLEEFFFGYQKENDLTAFYKEQLPVFKDNRIVFGNLNFYLGKIYIASDKKLAQEYFIKAKDIFSKVYKKDHQVFKAIEDGIAETKK